MRVLPDALERRGWAHTRLPRRTGQRVVDVGCGLGDDTRELARLVAPGGEAVGVDLSTEPVAEAERRNGGGSPATFIQADATALRLEDGSFDAYRSERLHQHLPNPAAAIAEAARVLRPGGVLRSPTRIGGGLIVAGDDRALTRRVLQAFDDSMANGRSGGLLTGQLREARFDVDAGVVPTVRTPGDVVGPPPLQPAAERRLFASLAAILVSGTRP